MANIPIHVRAATVNLMHWTFTLNKLASIALFLWSTETSVDFTVNRVENAPELVSVFLNVIINILELIASLSALLKLRRENLLTKLAKNRGQMAANSGTKDEHGPSLSLDTSAREESNVHKYLRRQHGLMTFVRPTAKIELRPRLAQHSILTRRTREENQNTV